MGKASRDKWLERIARARADAERDSKPDYGLWIGFVAFASAAFLFVLQENGVSVNWLLSAVIYAACVVTIVWSTNAHVFARRATTRLKYPTLLLILVLLGGVSYVGVKKQYDKDTSLPLPPPDAKYITYYGATGRTGGVSLNSLTGDVISGDATSEEEVNGDLLSRYADRYYLLAVCFHYRGDEDFKDVTDLSKSERSNISPGLILLRMPWNQHFRKEFGYFESTAYGLLLIPKEVNPNEISTIRNATHLGGYLIQEAMGPPGYDIKRR